MKQTTKGEWGNRKGRSDLLKQSVQCLTCYKRWQELPWLISSAVREIGPLCTCVAHCCLDYWIHWAHSLWRSAGSACQLRSYLLIVVIDDKERKLSPPSGQWFDTGTSGASESLVTCGSLNKETVWVVSFHAKRLKIEGIILLAWCTTPVKNVCRVIMDIFLIHELCSSSAIHILKYSLMITVSF